MSDKLFQFLLDSKTAKEFKAILKEIGMSEEYFFEKFSNLVVKNKGLPFNHSIISDEHSPYQVKAYSLVSNLIAQPKNTTIFADQDVDIFCIFSTLFEKMIKEEMGFMVTDAITHKEALINAVQHQKLIIQHVSVYDSHSIDLKHFHFNPLLDQPLQVLAEILTPFESERYITPTIVANLINTLGLNTPDLTFMQIEAVMLEKQDQANNEFDHKKKKVFFDILNLAKAVNSSPLAELLNTTDRAKHLDIAQSILDNKVILFELFHESQGDTDDLIQFMLGKAIKLAMSQVTTTNQHKPYFVISGDDSCSHLTSELFKPFEISAPQYHFISHTQLSPKSKSEYIHQTTLAQFGQQKILVNSEQLIHQKDKLELLSQCFTRTCLEFVAKSSPHSIIHTESLISTELRAI
jgi:antitoxin component of RelBE/YafQ-DinJ toxin-antitoxin module